VDVDGLHIIKRYVEEAMTRITRVLYR